MITKKELMLLLCDIHNAAPPLPEHIQVRLDAAVSRDSGSTVPQQFIEAASRYYCWLSLNGGKKQYTEKEIEAGALTLYRLAAIDGYDLEQEILPAIGWAVQDSFWSANVRSLAQLRKKSVKNGESKFTNIFGAYSASRCNLKKQPANRKEVIQDEREQRATQRLARKQSLGPNPGRGSGHAGLLG